MNKMMIIKINLIKKLKIMIRKFKTCKIITNSLLMLMNRN